MESSTGFVDAGTALANLTLPTSGRSRNIFRPDSLADLIIASDVAIDKNSSIIPRNWSAADFLSTGFGEVRNEEDLVEVEPSITATQMVTLPLAIWEGVIQDIDQEAGILYTLLTSKTNDTEEHLAEIPISEVEPADISLMQVGAVFYLEQYQRNWRGGRETTQVLRMRRCAVWTKRALDWIESEAAAFDKILPRYIQPEED